MQIGTTVAFQKNVTFLGKQNEQLFHTGGFEVLWRKIRSALFTVKMMITAMSGAATFPHTT